MKRILLSALLFAAGLPTVLASEWLPLQNRADLWLQVQQSINSGIKPSIASANRTMAKDNNLQFILIKAISGKPRFEHYDTVYQGYPVLNGRLILAIDAQGQPQQMLGALATGLSAELPNAAAAFTVDELAVRTWLQNKYQVNHTIDGLELYPAIFIDAGLAKVVYRISFRLSNSQGFSIERPQLIVDAQTLQVIKQWDGLANLQESRSTQLLTGELVAGGGAGGNEALGLNCYTPAPGLMEQCLGYEDIDVPVATEITFLNDNPDNIYSAFSGYPFIVTQNGSDCWLKNDYVTTIKKVKDTASDTAFNFDCDGDTEHFNQQSIDDNYWNYYSFFPINDAHFYGGVVMQMYDQYLRDIYPNQMESCPAGDVNTGFCLKPISQRANAKGQTGGDMSNANWDGEYVNYGNGGPYEMYSQTTIDIVAHEITHAITEWNSDPVWAGQSRALDESFSDIAAIATNDFFQRHLSGSYANSLLYKEKREHSWIYGWDVFLYGLGGRDFQVPSQDGRSIDDARDFEESMKAHAAGGVMNKLFYELVTRQGWTIEETFKLMLQANVSCWSPQVIFEDAGSCLLLLTSDADKFQQLDETLHSVGIISPVSEINALPFIFAQEVNRVDYKVVLPEIIEVASISSIEISWGDSTIVEPWNNDSAVAIDDYLEAVHDYADTGFMLFSITATLNDGSEWKGYRNVYISSDVAPSKDSTPDAFAFSAEVEVALAEMIYSNTMTISGINVATIIQVNNGEYSINEGEFTSQQGTITNGQQVVLKLLSSASHSDSTQALLTVGDVSAAFVVTTLEESTAPGESKDGNAGSSGGGATSLLELFFFFSLIGLNARLYRRTPSPSA